MYLSNSIYCRNSQKRPSIKVQRKVFCILIPVIKVKLYIITNFNSSISTCWTPHYKTQRDDEHKLHFLSTWTTFIQRNRVCVVIQLNKQIYLQTTLRLRESSKLEPDIMGFSALHLSTCVSSSGSGTNVTMLVTTVSLLDSSNCGNKRTSCRVL